MRKRGELCALEERICIECGECDKCDLDPEKQCDNCAKCIVTADFSAIEIEEILTEIDEEKQEEEKKFNQ